MNNELIRKLTLVLLTGTVVALVSIPALAQEKTEEQTETTPMPLPPPAPEPQPAQKPVPQPTPAPAPQVVYAPVATAPTAQASPYSSIRRQPKSLRPIDGQAPPPGYVEVERRRKGLVITGASVFGGTYLLCLGMSVLERPLAIPVIGPMMAGFRYESSAADYDDDYYYGNDDGWAEEEARDAEYEAKLFGVLGTVAQSAGIALFVAGMLSKKKLWLRQDIAGVKFQLTPTVVGYNDPGLGVVGTF